MVLKILLIFKLTTSLQTGTGSVTYTQSTQTIKCTSLTSDSAMWRVDFISPASGNKVVDSVDFVVTKSKAGVNGDVGNSPIQIFFVTLQMLVLKPSRPTFTYRPGLLVVQHLEVIYGIQIQSIVHLKLLGLVQVIMIQMLNKWLMMKSIEDIGLDPLPHSGKDGEKGDKGDKGERKYWSTWFRWMNGPSLSYRGTYSSSKVLCMDS